MFTSPFDGIVSGLALVALLVALGVALHAIFRREPVPRGRAVAAIAVVAGLLRLFRLGSPSFWLDELGTWWILDSRSVGELSDRLFTVIPNGGAYYWLLYGVARLGGRSELALRLPSAVLGLASIIVVAVIVRRVAPERPRAPLLAALLLSATYLHSVLSQDARPYTFVFLLAALATYAWVRLVQTDCASRYAGLGFALLAALLVREQWLAGVYVAALFVGLGAVALLRRSLAIAWRAVTIGIVFVALLVPALAKFRQDFGRMPYLDWMSALPPVRRMITGLEALGDPIPLGGLLLALCFVRLRAAPILVRALVGVIAAHLSLLLLALVLTGKSFFVSRYLFPLSIPMILVAAHGIDRAIDERPRLVRVWVAALLVGSLGALQVRALLLSGSFKEYRRDHRWREGTQQLEAALRPDDLVLLRSGFIEEDHAARDADDEEAERSRRFAQSVLAGAYNHRRIAPVSLTKTWQLLPSSAQRERIVAAVQATVAAGHRVFIFGSDALVDDRSYFDHLAEWLKARDPSLRVVARAQAGQITHWMLERSPPSP